jgi:threonine/homoserine/homoserine lactone efflux protein
MIEVAWLLFVMAPVVLIVTTGLDMILVMSRSTV